MKAIQIIKPGETKLIDIPRPVLQLDEVMVKILYAGFCGSDLNTWLGKNALAKMPVIPGHEIGGIIEAAGEKVPVHLLPGTPCTINPYTSCGYCSSCRNGRSNACRFNQTLGVQRDGAMCEYMAVPWEKVIADTDIPPKDFCLVEPVSVGFHAVDRGQVTGRDTVMVLGCGMIGIGAIVNAALRGAQVIAVDIDDNKLSTAKQLGAAFTINSRTENVHERLQGITGNSGPDVVIEAVGSPSTYQMAVNEAAFTGRVVCIGYAKEPITFETKYFVQKELDIRGSRNATTEDFHAVMDYLKQGICPLDLLISGIYKPEQVEEVFQRWTIEPARIFRLIITFDS
jgi:threonine dehydrogenase-like Zn-dependent dehydrogenase